MRSRYSAFAMADGAYLTKTRTGERRFGESAELERWAKSLTWLGLEIRRTERGQPDDDTGLVHFVARYLEAGKLVVMEEESGFEKRDGRWLYVDSEPTVTVTKLERNQSCPCGSGKKFKQCHA